MGRMHYIQNRFGFLNNRLAYMKFTAKAAGILYDPYSRQYPRWKSWDTALKAFNEKANPGINNALQTGGLDWCLMIMELRLIENMKYGLVIALGLCIVALMTFTGNVI